MNHSNYKQLIRKLRTQQVIHMATKCRSCGAPIRWAKTKTGKSIPLQREQGGNIILADGMAHVVNPGEGDWVTHFARCEHADHHRKR